jgi:DNA-directed RNA polymerase specialized sigma24 family protein
MVTGEESTDDEVERRLERWGRLARGRYEDLGINDRSMLARMIEEGAGAAQVADWASQHLPDDVVETDQAVARLPKRYRRAIKLHYMTELDSQSKAKAMDMSRSSFFLYVNAGKMGVYNTLVARL